MVRPKHPILLIVLDGWGVKKPGPYNAIERARCENLARLRSEHDYTELGASGLSVGLPPGQMGNSEVGHLNLGAGRTVFQDFVRINRAIRDRSLFANAVLRKAMEQGKRSRLHLVGLLGPGGVHGHDDHALALLKLAKSRGVRDVAIHHLLDGRDSPPKSALGFAKAFERRAHRIGVGRVATVAGRYWTMDRDQRWERNLKGYRLLVESKGLHAPSAVDAISLAYRRGETDEFVEPVVVGPSKPVRNRDVVVCFNFRPDRMRQIVRMLADPGFSEVPRKRVHVELVTMTQYDRTFEKLGVKVAFPPVHPQRTLGAYYAELGLRQLRVAETEKYAHVTYFFNGGIEEPVAGEERLLVPSPKVATYDLKPEMSAPEITQALLERLARGYDLVVVNFANADMVGHTGKMEATVEACRVVDRCVGQLVRRGLELGSVVAVTADHGNAEVMRDAQGRPQTAHTLNRVPFWLALPGGMRTALRKGGALSNVAPTLLELVGLPKPSEMTAKSLVARSAKATTRRRPRALAR